MVAMSKLPKLQVFNAKAKCHYYQFYQLYSSRSFSEYCKIMTLPVVYRSLESALETLNKNEVRFLLILNIYLFYFVRIPNCSSKRCNLLRNC